MNLSGSDKEKENKKNSGSIFLYMRVTIPGTSGSNVGLVWWGPNGKKDNTFVSFWRKAINGWVMEESL